MFKKELFAFVFHQDCTEHLVENKPGVSVPLKSLPSSRKKLPKDDVNRKKLSQETEKIWISGSVFVHPDAASPSSYSPVRW